MNKNKIYDRARSEWGDEAQMNMLVEESAEVIHAISKYRRITNDAMKSGAEWEKAQEHLRAELADLEIMLEQIKRMIGETQVDAYKKDKLQNLAEKRLGMKEDEYTDPQN